MEIINETPPSYIVLYFVKFSIKEKTYFTRQKQKVSIFKINVLLLIVLNYKKGFPFSYH